MAAETVGVTAADEVGVAAADAVEAGAEAVGHADSVDGAGAEAVAGVDAVDGAGAEAVEVSGPRGTGWKSSDMSDSKSTCLL